MEADSVPMTVPGFTGVGYSDVFTTMPPQPKKKKPGQLPTDKVKEFFEKGYTVVENFFTPEELQPCRDGCDRLVEELAQKLYKAGKIKSLYEDHGFDDRLILLEKEWPGAVIMLLKLGRLPPFFRDLWENEKLLNTVEQLLGPEVAANPIWNLRPKCPGHAETLVPWHQDSAYFDLDSYQSLIVTAWIPFIDSTKENGCMEMAEGGHLKGLVGVHKCCDNFYLMMDEEELQTRFDLKPENYKLCPVPYGGVLFFNNVIPHRSIPNTSDHVRWSIDLRWQSPERPWGFYGLKPGTLMRSARNPVTKVDWAAYDEVDRYHAQKKYELQRKGKDEELDEFDTSLTGPHMDKWEIVRHSPHTDQFLRDQNAK